MKTAISLAILTLFMLVSCMDKPRTETSENDLIVDTEEDLISPQIASYTAVSKANIRGLHLVSEQIGWASGSNGTILRMTNGEDWSGLNINGYTNLDIRDIHGYDSMNAIAMAAGDEGRIFKTIDGGQSWMQVYEDLSEGIFLDGMDFNGPLGICYGDPINGKFYGAFSKDSGNTWIKASMAGFPDPLEEEAGFAASGTGIVVMDDREYTATGGAASARVIRSMREMESDMRTEAFVTPVRSGEGCGIFSLAFKNKQEGVAVGGCYLDSLSTDGNCAFTKDAGRTWTLSDSLPPMGYRSCVLYNESIDAYVCCGRTGVDISYDGGQNWTSLSNEGYFTCASSGSVVWLMGRSGKMARISW